MADLPPGVGIVLAGVSDEGLFCRVADGVFDRAIRPEMLRRFLVHPEHHMAVALEGRVVVGMCTANEYLHPDKDVQAWINELGVAPTHRRRGIGRALVVAMLDRLRGRGVPRVWIATEHDNEPARAIYRSLLPEVTGGIVMYEGGLAR